MPDDSKREEEINFLSCSVFLANLNSKLLLDSLTALEANLFAFTQAG